MEEIQPAVINRLQHLARLCHDSELGYVSAADGTDDPELQVVFQDCATTRHQMVEEFDTAIRGLGGTMNLDAPVSDAMYRGWFTFDESLDPDDPLAILEECESREDYTRKQFSEALEMGLPPEPQDFVKRQLDKVRHVHDRIHALRDQRRH